MSGMGELHLEVYAEVHIKYSEFLEMHNFVQNAILVGKTFVMEHKNFLACKNL